MWGNDNGPCKIAKWGYEKYGGLGSGQNQTRLLNHAIVAIHAAHWLLGNRNRSECDDYNAHGTTFFRDDFREISVPFNSMISRHH